MSFCFILPIFTEALFTEKATHLSHGICLCVITIVKKNSKICAAVAPFVVHILLVTLFKEMSNIFVVKGFILVKSESLLPSVAKVWVGFHFRY